MTRKEEIENKAKVRADQYSHPVEWNDCYRHWIEGAEWADANPDEKMIAKYLYEKKGYPIDLNGNLPSFDETMKDVEQYLKYKQVKIGETQIYIEDDGGEPPYDGKQWLDLGCLEYEIPKDKFKDGDNVEIIIRKIRKEE